MNTFDQKFLVRKVKMYSTELELLGPKFLVLSSESPLREVPTLVAALYQAMNKMLLIEPIWLIKATL